LGTTDRGLWHLTTHTDYQPPANAPAHMAKHFEDFWACNPQLILIQLYLVASVLDEHQTELLSREGFRNDKVGMVRI
jgi:hypothetical protein